MAWTDSIFTSTPDREKLHLLARMSQAVYDGTFETAFGSAISNPRRLSAPPLLRAWACEVEGQTVVTVEGTTQGVQYPEIVAGYATPVAYGGAGLMNAMFYIQAENLWPSIPNETAVFNGHSMGGCIAQYLGYKAKAGNLPVVGCTTFGAPRPISKDGHALEGFPPTINVANEFDPIPLAAPDGTGGREWRSPGDEWRLLPDKSFSLSFQRPSTRLFWVAFVQTNGFAWHATQAYINGIEAEKPLVPSLVLGVPAVAIYIYRFEVKGLLMGQACDNGFWYRTDTDEQVGDHIDGFKAKWQNAILPLLSPQYEVVHYEMAKLAGVKIQDPEALPLVSLLRYTDFHRLVGTGADVGGSSNADPFPSYVTVGANKGCGAWMNANFTEFAPLRKRPRGMVSFGGIPRLDSRPTSEGNRLLDAKFENWRTKLLTLRVFGYTGAVWRMCVLTQYAEKVKGQPAALPLFDGADPPQPTFNVADVLSLTPNTYLGTRTSRKQTVSGRG